MSVIGSNVLAGASGQATEFAIERSLRFDSGSSGYLNRTPSSAGNRRTFTFACWIKRAGLGASHVNIFAAGSNRFRIALGAGDGHLQVYEYDGNNFNFNKGTGALFRDPSAWYHLVVAIDTTDATAADRVKVYVNGSRITDFGTSDGNPSQNLDTFVNNTSNVHYIGTLGDSSNYLDAYLADVYFIDGSALDPTSFGAYDDSGVWQGAAYSGTYGTNGFHLKFDDASSNAALGTDSSGNSNTWTVNNLTANAVNYNSTLTAIDTSETITNPGNAFDNDTSTTIGGITGGIKFTPIGGSQSNVTSLRFYSQSFGQGGTIKLNGSTIESNYDFGSGGWYAFSSSALSNISNTLTSFEWDRQPGSGSNNNDYLFGVEINGTVLVNTDDKEIDSLFDSPQNGTQSDTGAGGEVSGNYATWNPLNKPSAITLSNGNLDCQLGSSDATQLSTIGMSSGKWYVEITGVSTTGSFFNAIGLAEEGAGGYLGSDAKGWGYHQDGRKIAGGGASTYGATYTQGDVIGVAFDADNGTLTFYKNGSSQGTAYTGLTSGPYFFACGSSQTKNALNAGQRAFAYTAPSGYKTLCTTNLPTPTIADGSDYFEAKTYTGNGSTQSITGLEFSPDLVWTKKRNATQSHHLTDTVRGALKNLRSNTAGAETTDANTITSFNSDGFTLGSESAFNGNNDTFIAWAWGNGSTFTPTVSGFTSPSGRRNTTAGFSIVKVTGNNTVSSFDHGLGIAPALIISKNLDNSYDWGVYHEAVEAAPTKKFLNLNDNGAVASKSGNIYRVVSSSSVEVDSYAETGSTGDYVYYCFAPVAGYSAFGSYEGTGSATDSPFIFTGMRPAFVLVKNIDATDDWCIADTTRSSHNVQDETLFPNTSGGEDTGAFYIDILSNGFKPRNNTGKWNSSGHTFIYAAFSENAFSLNGGLAR